MRIFTILAAICKHVLLGNIYLIQAIEMKSPYIAFEFRGDLFHFRVIKIARKCTFVI